MSVELVKELVRALRVIGRETSQTVIESDIIVPDTKPDLEDIVNMDGDIYIRETEALQDRATIKGVIKYNILYLSNEPEQRIKSIQAEPEFAVTLDMEGVRQGVRLKAKCDIEHIDHEILNGRKISIKAVVRASCSACEEVEQNIVTGFGPDDRIQTLKGKVRVNCLLEEKDLPHTAKGQFVIPPEKPSVLEILKQDIKMLNKEMELAEGKILFRGNINITTLYIGDDERRSIQFIEHELPYEMEEEIGELDEDAKVTVDYSILDTRFETDEDSDGETRLLSGEVDLNIRLACFASREIELVEDAYSPSARIDIEKESLKFETIEEMEKTQLVLKEFIPLIGEDAGELEVLSILNKPIVVESGIEGDRLVVDGVVVSTVLCESSNSDRPLVRLGKEIPFKCQLDLEEAKPGAYCEVNAGVEHCSYSLTSPGEIELRIILGVEAKTAQQLEVPVTAGVMEQPAGEHRLASLPDIVIYFAKPGDNLWKVAKKYCTTVEDIQRLNNLTEFGLTPGQQVFIVKRAE